MKSKAAWISGCIGTAALWVVNLDEPNWGLLFLLLWTINLIVSRPLSEDEKFEVDIEKQELRLQIERNMDRIIGYKVAERRLP